MIRAPTLRKWRGADNIELRTLSLGLICGVGAVTAYGLVIYAKTIAPLGAV